MAYAAVYVARWSGHELSSQDYWRTYVVWTRSKPSIAFQLAAWYLCARVESRQSLIATGRWSRARFSIKGQEEILSSPETTLHTYGHGPLHYTEPPFQATSACIIHHIKHEHAH